MTGVASPRARADDGAGSAGLEPRRGGLLLWLHRARRLIRAVRELAFRSGSRYTHLHALLPQEGRAPSNASESVRWADAVVGGRRRTSLVMSTGTSVTYRLRVEPGAVFRAFVAADPAGGPAASTPLWCRAVARTLAGGAQTQAVHAIRPWRASAPAWEEIRLGLRHVAAEEVCLELAVEGAQPGELGTARAVWGDPALFVRDASRGSAWPRALKRLAAALTGGDVTKELQRIVDLAEQLSLEPRFRGSPAEDSDRLHARVRELPHRPLITLLVAGHGPDDALARSLWSLGAQFYGDWEAWIYASGALPTPVLPADPRVKVSPRTGNGPADALNGALAACSGEFLALLNPGDELSTDALLRMVEELGTEPVPDVLYTDEAPPDGLGEETEVRKPDWSPELLLSYPYVGRLCLLRRDLVERLGGWRDETLAAEEYDLVLRATAAGARIRHVRRLLYRRAPRKEGADRFSGKAALAARRAALEAHLGAAGLWGEVTSAPPPVHLRVRCALPDRPLVSILVPTRDRLPLLRQCLDSVERRTDYAPYEIVIVDNESTDPATLEFLSRSPHRVLPFPGPFNFAAINNAAARAARGEYLVFLNNDTEVRSPEWLSAMLEWARQPAVGCVGAKLLLPDGRLQHVGVVLRRGAPEHLFHHQRPGRGNRWTDTELVRNYASVTAACMMIKRSVFEEAGGFDESFPVNYNDVDLCLRLLRRGFRHVYTPFAVLLHHESASRSPGATDSEYRHLTARHGQWLSNDPYWPPLASSRVEADA